MTDVGSLKQTACIDCPKAMVGRVIGKGGETIKALYVGLQWPVPVASASNCASDISISPTPHQHVTGNNTPAQ